MAILTLVQAARTRTNTKGQELEELRDLIADEMNPTATPLSKEDKARLDTLSKKYEDEAAQMRERQKKVMDGKKSKDTEKKLPKARAKFLKHKLRELSKGPLTDNDMGKVQEILQQYPEDALDLYKHEYKEPAEEPKFPDAAKRKRYRAQRQQMGGMRDLFLKTCLNNLAVGKHVPEHDLNRLHEIFDQYPSDAAWAFRKEYQKVREDADEPIKFENREDAEKYKETVKALRHRIKPVLDDHAKLKSFLQRANDGDGFANTEIEEMRELMHKYPQDIDRMKKEVGWRSDSEHEEWKAKQQAKEDRRKRQEEFESDEDFGIEVDEPMTHDEFKAYKDLHAKMKGLAEKDDADGDALPDKKAIKPNELRKFFALREKAKKGKADPGIDLNSVKTDKTTEKMLDSWHKLHDEEMRKEEESDEDIGSLLEDSSEPAEEQDEEKPETEEAEEPEKTEEPEVEEEEADEADEQEEEEPEANEEEEAKDEPAEEDNDTAEPTAREPSPESEPEPTAKEPSPEPEPTAQEPSEESVEPTAHEPSPEPEEEEDEEHNEDVDISEEEDTSPTQTEDTSPTQVEDTSPTHEEETKHDTLPEDVPTEIPKTEKPKEVAKEDVDIEDDEKPKAKKAPKKPKLKVVRNEDVDVDDEDDGKRPKSKAKGKGKGKAKEPEKAEPDSETMKPDDFHKVHDRCPEGYHWNGKHCVEVAKEEKKDEKAKRAPKKDDRARTRPKSKTPAQPKRDRGDDRRQERERQTKEQKAKANRRRRQQEREKERRDEERREMAHQKKMEQLERQKETQRKLREQKMKKQKEETRRRRKLEKKKESDKRWRTPMKAAGLPPFLW